MSSKKATDMKSKIVFKDAHFEAKLIVGEREFKVESYGTGNDCTVEIDEMDMGTGMSHGHRKSYRVPGRIKWSVVVKRYTEDLTDPRKFYSRGIVG